MKKIHSFALVAVAALALTACGGGGGDDAPSANPGTGTGTGTGTGSGGVAGTPTAPVTATFTGHHYLQNLGSPGTTANFRDIGVGAEGTLTYGAQGKVVSMTPQADGSIVYGAPITASVAVGDNLLADNLPAIAMLCQAAASGDGTKGAKSTDVLVKAQAIRITDAKALANQVFSIAREDCAVTAGVSLRFDASGNATVADGSGTTNFTAAAVSNALVGNAPLESGAEDGFNGFVSLYAYSYGKPDGSTVYAVVDHGGTALTNLSKGYLLLWSQQ